MPSSPAVGRGVAFALAALLLVMLARTLWLLVAGPQVPDPGPPDLPASPDAPAGSLAQWQLFGSREGPAAVVHAPPTALGLQLRGTLAAADPGAGLALVADGESERAYRVGDRLPGDAVLEAVHPDRVLIRRDGRTESLALPRAAVGDASPAAVLPAPIEAAVGPTSLGRPDFATQRAAQAPRIAALLDQANLLPATENGRVVGVRIGSRDRGLLAPLGLEPDDVITSVNGVPLDAPQRLPELPALLQHGGDLRVAVRRDGRTFDLNLAL
ncbi:type II secretion system protein N [Coralloluteibacterium thermophilus]|uniref:Type II secretion system protein N n=1 Tax=Coralloluteibacterium thermophilum TaxID=2707049 RepID=A0ABV9NE02_9GAMM